MKRLSFLVTLILLGWSGSVVQAQNLDALKACTRISNEIARLSCYDGVVVSFDASLATEITARKQETLTRQTEKKRLAELKSAQNKVDSFGANNLPPERQPEVRVKIPDVLEAKIETISYDPFNNIVALLDNGQTWVQTESQALPRVRPGDDVQIKRGALGSYRMVIVRMNRALQVKRRR
jgi:cell shape-determining protein MreC